MNYYFIEIFFSFYSFMLLASPRSLIPVKGSQGILTCLNSLREKGMLKLNQTLIPIKNVQVINYENYCRNSHRNRCKSSGSV